MSGSTLSRLPSCLRLPRRDAGMSFHGTCSMHSTATSPCAVTHIGTTLQDHRIYTSHSYLIMYRWSAIPVVRVAQLETVVDLPVQIIEPWTYLQSHFGCTSESGNSMSNLVLNFDFSGAYVHKINVGLSHTIMSSEEAFSRVFHELETLVSTFPLSTTPYWVQRSLTRTSAA